MENYAEGELGIKQKKEHEAREQALASLGGRVNENHKVRIWNIHDKKYIEVEPVDGAEMIAIGSACLDKPEDEPVSELENKALGGL